MYYYNGDEGMENGNDYEKKTRPLEFLRIKTLSPKPHMHSEIETVICLKGKCNAYIDGKCFELCDGEMITVFPRCGHFYDVTEEGDFALLVYYPEIIPNVGDVFVSSLPENPKTEANGAILSLTELLSEKYDRNDRSSELLLTGCLNLMMYEILPKLQPRSISDSRSLAEKIMKYCADRFAEEITLDGIAHSFGMSKSGISHIFNGVTGLSIPHYVNWLRISSACKLLTTTDMTVTEIASKVGFSTLRNFNRVFISMMNTTPTAYREQYYGNK